MITASLPISSQVGAIALVPQGGSQKSKVKSQKYYGISSLALFSFLQRLKKKSMILTMASNTAIPM
ncbi:hypothetical protein [Nostoc sp.]|uniref:hypothetical protein n=1 Tax=Nostoc sp. TaxID=1180 RepID=UPI002FF9E1F1